MSDTLTEKQSLDIIQEMIMKAKNQYSEDGQYYLLWGWVILFCSIAHFVLDVLLNFDRPWQVWGVTWIVAVYMVISIRLKERKAKVKTYSDEIIGAVWICFVIMMVVTFFILQRFVPEFYLYNFLFILVLYGMPTFLSGAILQFRPLIIGGIACWILAAAGGFVSFRFHPLFVSAAVICAWIIPGHILRFRFKKQMR